MTVQQQLTALQKEIASLRRQLTPEPLWENREGTKLYSADMHNKHLLNTISLFYAMERKQHYLPLLIAEAKQRGLTLPDPRTC